ncbi:hypothetical protein FRC01_003716 [Tulasnella sp. 417]|nr:hypothetical protein FRC01_003716 [Tulasnella sp. 417]
MDNLHPPLRSPVGNGNGRTSYVSSPLNPSPLNPNVTGGPASRSRPPSFGGHGALEPGRTPPGGSTDNVARDDKDTIRNVMTGAVGSGYGPYANVRGSFAAPPHNRFSTLSSVGSVVSLPTDSKYPSMYFANSDRPVQGGFFPYSDTPHLDFTNSFTPDDDDALHDPDPRKMNEGMGPMNWRGLLNISFVFLIVAALIALFAGYPIISYLEHDEIYYAGANVVGVNETGQAAVIPNLPQLIDPETPEEAKTRTGYDGYEYELVFSDEFNVDGRTFYPGDDPFWEGVDLWYGATEDIEWYDPGMITTANGSLVITLEEYPNHGLNYRSGMLQSWNKFCFSGGYIEVSVLFPGDQLAMGFWPAAWTMGNLGRPGYGASSDGTWPYTYNTCDVGTLPNQTRADLTPTAAQTSGKSKANGVLSYLPGQRLSACTCPGEDHPGPSVNVGRAAPEIDIFEAERSKTGGPGGQTSQSSQYAPFNNAYEYNTAATTLYLPTTYHNTFLGSDTQQSISSLTDMDESWFENSLTPTYATYGLEFLGDDKNPENGFINWVAGGQRSWGLTAAAFGPDAVTEISQRTVSVEPMSIVLNLGISESFQTVDTSTLTLPAHLRFDYVRVYQRKGQTNVGCDPENYPTAKYINDHLNAYTNVNLTHWAGAGYTFPKNSLKDGC